MPECGVENTITHAFFMDFFGDKTLLDRPLVGFLASRSVSAATIARCRAWAQSICGTDSVVISGFHSPLEHELLQIFLERRHPVVWALGRSIYRHVEPAVAEAIDEGRLLMLSVCPGTRHSLYSARLRNRFIAERAREVVFAAFDRSSSLTPLHDLLVAMEKPTTVIP